MIRVLHLLAIVLTIMHLPVFVFIPLVLIYAFYYRGYELILLAGCIDVYYGEVGFIPYYTIGVTLLIVLVEYFRPALNLKNPFVSS